MLISTLMIGILQIELISKNIFSKAYNDFPSNIKNIVNIGSYQDIIDIKKHLIIKENFIAENIKLLEISLTTNQQTTTTIFRMFYEK